MSIKATVWLDRVGVAARLEALLGRPVSPRSIADLEIPYKIVLKRAMSDQRDVDAYAAALLKNSTRRLVSAHPG
jgi:hypothetical protein